MAGNQGDSAIATAPANPQVLTDQVELSQRVQGLTAGHAQPGSAAACDGQPLAGMGAFSYAPAMALGARLGAANNTKSPVAQAASSDNQQAAPTSNWDKFVDVTEQGFKDLPQGIWHALENPGRLAENAVISVGLGAAAKVLLPEAGPLGSLCAVGLGLYFGEQAAVPVYKAYKTGMSAKTMGEIDSAGSQVGDALGGLAVNLPIGIYGYKLGAGIGDGIMASPKMAGFAEFKANTLNPINSALASGIDASMARIGSMLGRKSDPVPAVDAASGINSSASGASDRASTAGPVGNGASDRTGTETGSLDRASAIKPGRPATVDAATSVDSASSGAVDQAEVGKPGGPVEATERAESGKAASQPPSLPERYRPIQEKFAGTTVPGISRAFLKNLQTDDAGTYYGAGLRYPDLMADPDMASYLQGHNQFTLSQLSPGVYEEELANEAKAGGTFDQPPPGWHDGQSDQTLNAIDVTDGGDGSMTVGSKTLTVTDDGAPNRKVVVTDSPGSGQPTTLIPESKDFEIEQLIQVQANGAAKYALVGSQDGADVLHVYDADGNHVSQISLPGYGTLHDVRPGPSPSQVQFLYDTPISPPQALTLDLATNKSELTPLPGYNFNTDDFVTDKIKVPYTDRNGNAQEVPFYVSYPKDIVLNGQNRALMEIYGGFDVAPQYLGYMPNSASWLMRGGVTVDPVLPGDGGLGTGNYDEGILAGIENDTLALSAIIQKVHDMGFSSPDTTGLYGRSNGGMEVLTFLNNRPGLVGAAVSESGVDSLFDSPVVNVDTGKYWEPEFGDPHDPAQVAWMAKLDPLNNLSRAKQLPPTLIEIGTKDGVVNVGNGITYATLRQGMNNGETLLYARIGEGHDPTSLALQTAFLWDRLKPQTGTLS